MSKLLIEKLQNIELLRKSWHSVYKGKSEDVRRASRGVDEISLYEFKSNEHVELERLRHDLTIGNYKHADLFGFPVLKQNKKKYRLVTAPSVRDRVVERAILEIIKPYIFPFANSSVSYCGTQDEKKKKRNSLHAFRKIIELVSQGNFIVFESDIKGFFDEIPKGELYNMIISKLPDDSLDHILRDVIYFKIGNENEIVQGGKIEMMPHVDKGISQGSPLSPLFANLYLDSFDRQALEKFGTNLIRYVDDFIFLTSELTTANEFHRFSENLLRGMGLSIPPASLSSDSKTKVVDLKNSDAEFVFLGVKVNRKGLWPKRAFKEVQHEITKECLPHNLRRYRKLSYQDKIKKMNESLSGLADYYLPFHSTSLLTQINENILINYTRRKDYKGLKLIPTYSRQREIILNDDWQKLFP